MNTMGVCCGDQLLRADTQQAEIGVEAVQRPRKAATHGAQIDVAHGELDQAQAIGPGGVEQEAA
jgi:hypothetical protein